MAVLRWLVVAAALGSGRGIDDRDIDECGKEGDNNIAPPSYYPDPTNFKTGSNVDGGFDSSDCVLITDPLDFSGVMVGFKWWVGRHNENMTLKLMKKKKDVSEYTVLATAGPFRAPRTHMNWAAVAHLRQTVGSLKFSKSWEIVAKQSYLAWCGQQGSMDYNEVDKVSSGVIRMKAGTGSEPEVYEYNEATDAKQRKYVFQVEYLQSDVSQCVRFAAGLTGWPTSAEIDNLNDNLGESQVCFLIDTSTEAGEEASMKCINNNSEVGNVRKDYQNSVHYLGLYGKGVLIIPDDPIQIEGILEHVQFLSYIAKDETRTEYTFLTTKKIKNNRYEVVSVTEGGRQSLKSANSQNKEVLTMQTIFPAENLHIEKGQYFGWWRLGTALMRADVDEKGTGNRPTIQIMANKDKPVEGSKHWVEKGTLSRWGISYYYKLKIYRYNRDLWSSNWYENETKIWSRCDKLKDAECNDE